MDPEPGHEAPVGREPCAVKLGIAARQIDRVGVLTRSFVAKRGERPDLGAGGAPAVEHRRIGEGEGDIGGDGDARGEQRQHWDRRGIDVATDRGVAGELIKRRAE